MRQILTMTASDLRQRVRDKSVIIFALLVPMALMFVFNLVFGGADEIELEPVTVAVSADAADPLAGVITEAVTGIDTLDVTVEAHSVSEADAARDAAESGDAALAVLVPAGFGDAIRAGDPVDVQAIQGESAGIETDILIAVIDGVLQRLSAGTVAAAAGADLGLAPQDLATIAQDAATAGPAIVLTEGEASNEQLSAGGAIVAGQAGLFLLFTVGFGVIGLITEREQGTLARLHSMPMRPGYVVVAKALVSFVLGVVATAVLLVAGGLFFDVSFGSPLAVGLLIVAVVTAATSMMFVVVRVARTAEQANIVQSILAMVLGVGGGAFFPISGSGLLGTVLDLNPVAAFIRGLGVTAGGGGIAAIGAPLAIMAGFAAVALLASRLVPNRAAAL